MENEIERKTKMMRDIDASLLGVVGALHGVVEKLEGWGGTYRSYSEGVGSIRDSVNALDSVVSRLGASGEKDRGNKTEGDDVQHTMKDNGTNYFETAMANLIELQREKTPQWRPQFTIPLGWTPAVGDVVTATANGVETTSQIKQSFLYGVYLHAVKGLVIFDVLRLESEEVAARYMKDKMARLRGGDIVMTPRGVGRYVRPSDEPSYLHLVFFDGKDDGVFNERDIFPHEDGNEIKQLFFQGAIVGRKNAKFHQFGRVGKVVREQGRILVFLDGHPKPYDQDELYGNVPSEPLLYTANFGTKVVVGGEQGIYWHVDLNSPLHWVIFPGGDSRLYDINDISYP